MVMWADAISVDPILVLNAFTYACMLSLASIGLTATYLTTKVPNFAQGSFLMVGAYTTILLVLKFGWNPYYAVLPAALAGGLAGLFTYYVAIYPLLRRGAKSTTLMIATLAVAIMFYGIMNIIADAYARLGIRSRDVGLAHLDVVVPGLGIKGVYLAAPAMAFGTTIALYLLLTKTKLGVAFRATVENPDLARVMGVNTYAVMATSWFISGFLGGLGGSIYPLFLRLAHPNAGDDMLPSIFAASVVGGLQSIYGGLIGGLIIGLSEKLITGLLGQIWPGITVYQYVVSMAFLIAALVVMPRGIMGLLKRV